MKALLSAVERGFVPDPLVRFGIRRLLARRLAAENPATPAAHEEKIGRLLAQMRTGPVAPLPEAANEQHYELPARLFELTLGPQLKYSACHWSDDTPGLAAAEEAMLELTVERAALADGQEILELGCGWGSLSLFMAERFPSSRILAVSNSVPQRRFIEARAKERGITNLSVQTADMNDFEPAGSAATGAFDRVVSVEMFEHMRNWPELLRRIRGWLKNEGKLFIHIFCHHRLAYPFEVRDSSDWMARYFFTGGLMPSADLLPRAAEGILRPEEQWLISGRHYARTSSAWLENLDRHRHEVRQVLAETYGPENVETWWNRWRLFYMACEELFGFRDGSEWQVGHYLLDNS